MVEINFMNLVFRGLTRECLLKDTNKLKIVVTVNAEFIALANEDESFKKIICENYSTFDGQIPYALAKIKFPDVEIEKISGSDFIYDICANAKQFNKRVFLLGGFQASNLGAVAIIREEYGIEIEGFSPPYKPYPFSNDHNQLILDRIMEFKPHFLLVGFGAKKQESWIVEHQSLFIEMGVNMAIGVGGTFEFVSNSIKRAPVWMQCAGLEGVYRFVIDPNSARLKRLILSFKIFKYYFS